MQAATNFPLSDYAAELSAFEHEKAGGDDAPADDPGAAGCGGALPFDAEGVLDVADARGWAFDEALEFDDLT